jgi:G3E family GTPase
MLPTAIITGFLGSGKTTLLNRLLRHAALANSLVIINEFGEVAIDHLVVAAPAAGVKLLNSGCLCCAPRGELVETLSAALRLRAGDALPAFERVLIETSGLADPVPIVHTLAREPVLAGAYRLDSILAVLDALHGAAQLQTHDEARKQVALADTVLLSKIDLANAAELPELDTAVRRINPAAEILPADEAASDPLALLRARPGASAAAAVTGTMAHAAHRDGIRTFSFVLDLCASAAGLSTWLSMLASFKAQHLLRVKGIVNVAGQPVVIDVVQSVVHEPSRLEQWPTSDECTRLVFIARELERADIERTFCAFDIGDALPARRGFDAAAYARFAEAAKSFL